MSKINSSESPLKTSLAANECSSSMPVDVSFNESQQNGHSVPGKLGTLEIDGAETSMTDSENASEIEDYDTQKPDLATVVGGSRGGDLKDGLQATSVQGDVQKPDLARRSSIPVRLEETEKKGRYMLTLDDAEIRDILRALETRNAISTTTPRKSLRDLVFTRQFTTFDRQSPTSAESPFRGFFTLFWLSMALMFLRVAAQNYKTYGSILGQNEAMRMMFGKDVLVLGLSDGIMVASTTFGLILQHLVLRDIISWNRSGWIIQNIWQSLYLGAIMAWTMYREWPWTHTIFIVLHALVFLMKQHSYSFYNGYLSQVYKRKKKLERRLEQLEQKSPIESPKLARISTFTSTFSADDRSNTPKVRRRRIWEGGRRGSNLSVEPSEIASVAASISSGQPIDSEQMKAFSDIISDEIKALDEELNGKCSVTDSKYPTNLTFSNFIEWTCLPTLVYELEYPRQERIDWWYVAEKTSATFGGIGIMMVVSQAYLHPLVSNAIKMKEQGMTLQERWREFPWVVSDMLFPLLLEQLLSWYVIWECVLNVLAELTRFADRGFYGDWWNSVSWDQYARDWNRPVHNFLLRHVYHSSISAFHLSKMSAMLATFFLSACVHELLMFCLFKKVRGYLFTLQLMQVPLAALSRTKLLRGRNVLGNIIFWIGLFVGPSVITGLYLII